MSLIINSKIEHFNKENHILLIKDRKTGEILDSLKLMWVKEDDSVRVSYKGNFIVESKKLKYPESPSSKEL